METSVQRSFVVKAGEFEGPLELLLELIEKRKLHVSQVSLSEVADDFLEYIKNFEEFPIADSADFILIASTLLLIKSKSLLPTLPLTTEEEESIEDLEARLVTYQKYKELAGEIGKMFGDFMYFGLENKKRKPIFAPTGEITISNLKRSCLEALGNMPKKQELPKVTVKKVISLEEMIENLRERMQSSIKTTFREFSGAGSKAGSSTSSGQVKINVIVSFLAMLELCKQGLIRINQSSHFDDIEIEAEEIDTPHY